MDFLYYDPLHLEPEELKHELSIRGIVGLSSHRDETKALRNALLKESRKEEEPPISNILNNENEILSAENIFKILNVSITNAISGKSIEALKVLKSRVAVWINRLRRIEDVDTLRYEQIILQFSNLYESLEETNLRFRLKEKLISSSLDNLASDLTSANHFTQVAKIPEALNMNRSSLPGTYTTDTINKSGLGRGRGVIRKNQLGKITNENDFLNLTTNEKNQFIPKELDPRFEDAMQFINNERSNNGNDLRNFNITSRYPRVHQWDIRFTGDGNGMSLSDFLIKVDIFAQGEGIEDEQLLIHIHKLFPLNSKAYKWYWSNIRGFRNYKDFIRQIRLEFLPSNYDFLLKDEINNRIQGNEETFSEFITDLKTMFQRANPPLGEDFKLFVIQKNMNPEYLTQTTTHNFNNVEQLIGICKRFDEVKLLKERRKLSTQYYNNNVTLVEPSCHPRASMCNNSFRPKQIGNVHCVEYSKCCNHTCENETHPAQILNRNEKAHSFGNLQNSKECNEFQQITTCHQYEGQNDGFVDMVSSNVKNKVFDMVCFNCKNPGHRRQHCNQPQTRKYCYLCGTDGVISTNCSNCRAKFQNSTRFSTSRNTNSNNPNNHSNSLGNGTREEYSVGANVLPQN